VAISPETRGPPPARVFKSTFMQKKNDQSHE
jgi:hypothetical protein